jgi:hypothetical protein
MNFDLVLSWLESFDSCAASEVTVNCALWFYPDRERLYDAASENLKEKTVTQYTSNGYAQSIHSICINDVDFIISF